MSQTATAAAEQWELEDLDQPAPDPSREDMPGELRLTWPGGPSHIPTQRHPGKSTTAACWKKGPGLQRFPTWGGVRARAFFVVVPVLVGAPASLTVEIW